MIGGFGHWAAFKILKGYTFLINRFANLDGYSYIFMEY